MDNRNVVMNPHDNLLTLEEHFYALQDVKEPNVFRNLFPYEEVPKIVFNHRVVPPNMPEEIWITDTTFRDGQQSRAPYSTEQIVTLFDYMHRLSGPKGIIRQSEFFLYSEKDRNAVYKCMERGYEFPEITSWIRANKKDFELVREMGIKETGILVSCSDYHIFYKMKMTRKQAMEHYLSVVRECLETGVRPRCHLEDITRSDIYGFVIPFCLELQKLGESYGIPIKIRACDTMGYGVNFTGAAIPRSVPGIIYGLNVHAGVPSNMLEWHGHNDFYKAVVNSSTAWLYGASAVNCSLFGIGERTGNTPLEAMVFEYAQLRGTLDGMDTTVITEMAEYYEKEIGYKLPSRTPFVGKNFNVTRAGIHADGLLKNEEIYNIFDTEKFLNRPVMVAVSNTSGLAGIAHWINTYFRLKGDKCVTKSDPLIAWLYGASAVNCSLFGIGERTGNTPLEAMVFEYAQLRGTLDGMDTTVITEMAEYYEKEIGYKLPSRTPFVGKNFNVTRAGIHADGLLKNEEIYNIFDTEKFLNRPVMVAVSNTSGLAGIAHWINTYFRLKGDKCVTKSDPLIAYVKEWVDKEYESGRVTSLTDEELLKVIDEGCKACNYTIGA